MLTPLFILVAIGALVWAWRSKSVMDNDDEICRECGYDLRASTGRCPECGTPFTRTGDHIPLRDDWPANPISPRRAAADETPVVIHSTDKQFEAQTFRDQLEFRGITAKLQQPAAGDIQAYGVPIGKPRGSWQVVIWSGDVEQAAVIRDRLIPPSPAEISQKDADL